MNTSLLQRHPEALGVALVLLMTSPLQSADPDESSSSESADVATEVEPSSAEARLTVHGKVVDKSDNPVPNAVIVSKSYSETRQTIVADENGLFQFTVPVTTKRLMLMIRDVADANMWVGDIFFNDRFDRKRPGLDEPLLAKLSSIVESKVTVVDEDAQPVAGATVAVQSSLDEAAVLTTDAQGQVLARLPDNGTPPMIMAFKSGKGYDYFSGDVRDTNNYPVKNPPKLPKKLVLVLNGARTVRVKAVDSQGRAVPGIAVHPWYVNKQGNPGDTNFGTDAFTQFTDNNGMAVFDWMPPNVERAVTFWVRSPDYNADRLTVEWEKLDQQKDYEVKLLKHTVLAGKVVDADGQPVAGASVKAHGTGMGVDSSDGQATSNVDGQFSMSVSPNKAYIAHSIHGATAGYVSPIVIFENKPVRDVEIRLKPATAVRGKVTRGTPPRPVASQWISLQLDAGAVPDEIEQLRPEGNRTHKAVYHYDGVNTNENGLFLFFAAPGKYVLFGPRQAKAEKFTITNERHINRNFHVPRQEFQQFSGIVRDPNGQPVANAKVHGVYASANSSRHEFIGTTNADGKFEIERETQPAMVYVQSAGKAKAAVIEIDGDVEARDVVLQPTFAAKGRLLDGDKNPVIGAVVKYGIKVHQGDKDAAWVTSFGGKVKTDDEGRYQINDLAQGIQYDIDLERSPEGPWMQIAVVTRKNAKLVDLGEKQVPASKRRGALK